MLMTRKVLRFGMPIRYAIDVKNRFKQHEKKGVRMVFWRTLQDISKSMYYLLDHPIYLHKISLISLNKQVIKDLKYHSNRFWLISAIIDIMCDVVDLYQIQKDIQIAVSSIILISKILIVNGIETKLFGEVEFEKKFTSKCIGCKRKVEETVFTTLPKVTKHFEESGRHTYFASLYGYKESQRIDCWILWYYFFYNFSVQSLGQAMNKSLIIEL
ncbi:pex11 domain containing protein [Stylonychia lemnae]|uniref:Pex11 domain containing protein n=1 Tax=Stylonychia lemnae TaxID=5949 RepID=A0A078AW18_STYLE|nr:pex11 domain containing protein [Stylonychia lemnae]|eukprot:CDW86281.1 pex11 domain containing protein [Stylonychia lemnae]